MKKLSLIFAGTILLGGLSFASPVIKQDSKAPVAQKNAKPAVKAKKGAATKSKKGKTSPHQTAKKAPAAKSTPMKKSAN